MIENWIAFQINFIQKAALEFYKQFEYGENRLIHVQLNSDWYAKIN